MIEGILSKDHVFYDDLIAEMEWPEESKAIVPHTAVIQARPGHTSGDGKLHAILGASSADRWMRCPGSVRMSRGMPNRSSRYAQEGTVAHHLCELALSSDVAPAWFIGQFLNLKGDLTDDFPEEDDPENMAFEIDDEMAEAVQMHVDLIEQTYQELLAEYPGQEIHRFLEKGFDLSRLYPDMFGTNDYALFVIGQILVVIDYKHGRGKVVEAKNNPQLLYYALGAILELCKTKADLPHTVRTVIVQPRAAHRDGPIRSWDYTLQEVMDFSKELIAAAKRTEDPDAPLVPGEVQCFFCNGKPKPCPALREYAQELAMQDFTDLGDDEVSVVVGAKVVLTSHGENLAKAMVEKTLSNRDYLLACLKMAPVLDAWIRDMETYAQHEHENGRPIIDSQTGEQPFKLVRKRSNRKLRNEADTAKGLLKLGYTEKDIMKEPKVKTPAQLEKSIPKEVVAQFSFHPEGKLTLVPQQDARPAIELNPFADLGDDEFVIEGDFTRLPSPEEDEWDIL